MLFKEFRQKRWKSKLYKATEQANALIDFINSGRLGYGMEYVNKLIRIKGRIGKYKGLLEISENDYEQKIKEILNDK